MVMAMNKCGDCVHYAECEKWVEPNETFPEMDSGCPAFKREQKWISVTERLPEMGKRHDVLCVVRHKDPKYTKRFVEVLEYDARDEAYPGSTERRITMEKPIITNADAIRHMTDDQLAYWIMCPYDHICKDDTKCIECTKEWLKKPCEVDDE